MFDLSEREMSLPIASAARCTSAGLAHVGEDLKRPAVFVFIDCDIELPASGLHEARAAADHRRSFFRHHLARFGLQLRLFFVFPVLRTVLLSTHRDTR